MKQYGITQRRLRACGNLDVPCGTLVTIIYGSGRYYGHFVTLDGRFIYGVQPNHETDVIKFKETKLLKLLFE
jgi:hypothetical protein